VTRAVPRGLRVLLAVSVAVVAAFSATVLPATRASSAAAGPPVPRDSDTPTPAGSRVSGKYIPTEEGTRVERLLDEWRFSEGEAALTALAASQGSTAEVLYLQGYERFLAGDYPVGVAKLRAAGEQAPEDVNIKSLGALVAAAEKAIAGHSERRSAHFVLRYPSEDGVLADYALEALETALQNLGADLGYTPARPIHVDIYRSPSDLAAVSTLTEQEVQRTGTIALCKWGRLMATSPRALSYGYPWIDSLSHELVHYVVSALSRDRTPVWLQEGLAKFLERRWRDPPSAALPPVMQHLLAKALASGKLIGFDRMHPSMAKLPTAEDASLAFAEVATAVASLHAKGGMPALRDAIAGVREGLDARAAVARAASGSWADFERNWKAFMALQKYRTFPGMEPVTRKFRKTAAIASRRAPSEDEEISSSAPARYLRLGNMLLRRNRARAAAIEYEKGSKLAGRGHWLFDIKLGRTYLALDQPERALKAVGELLILQPELPWPHLIAGQALLEKGEARAAISALEMSLATNPFDPAVHCSLADAYAKLPGPAATDTARRTRAERHCRELRNQ
jgi:tetratricopeptide (TPR) repeat protein